MSGTEKITDFHAFLEAAGRLEHCSIIVAARDTIVPDEAHSRIDEAGYERLQALGIRCLRADNPAEQFWSGYTACLADGRAVHEELAGRDHASEYEYTEDGFALKIYSAPLNGGNRASVEINGQEYAVDRRGLNFVIYDREKRSVTDSVCFDTWQKEIPCGRKSTSDAMICNTKKGDNFDVGLMGVWSGCNYGSIATYYALNRTIERMGHSVLMIDKPSIVNEDVEMKMNHSRRFAAEHYHISRSYRVEELPELNDYCDAFLLGSDQLWNYGISKNFGKSYYLDYVRPGKKKISYATSFGHGVDFAPPEEREVIAGLMKQFDAISVREADGVKICRESYGIHAVQVLDPVFLANREIFDELTEHSRFQTDEKYVACYILDPTPGKVRLMRQVAKRLGCTLVNVLDGLPWLFRKNQEKLGMDAVENVRVEEWLWIIRNCQFLITDSCHGASFGLVYNKPLIVLANRHRGISRFASLSELFDIGDRVLGKAADGIGRDDLLEEMDYTRINEKLSSERRRCRKWLKRAIERPSLLLSPVSMSRHPEIYLREKVSSVVRKGK